MICAICPADYLYWKENGVTQAAFYKLLFSASSLKLILYCSLFIKSYFKTCSRSIFEQPKLLNLARSKNTMEPLYFDSTL